MLLIITFAAYLCALHGMFTDLQSAYWVCWVHLSICLYARMKELKNCPWNMVLLNCWTISIFI
jgi:hypothetical protein